MTILCEPDPDRAARICGALGENVLVVATLADAALALAAGNEPPVVIGPDVATDSVESFTAELHTERSDATVVLLRDTVDDGLAARMHGAGVAAVVRSDDADVLSAALAAQAAPGGPRTQGDVITVFSAKGGCGTTVVATNLAVALAAGGTRSVCLVDLDLAFGDVAITLRLTPRRTIVDGIDAGGSIAGQLDHLVTTYRPGLDCVLAPVGPAEAEKVPVALVIDLLATLRERYDAVVVDTASHLTEHVLAAMDASRAHVLVTAPDMAALKNLRLTLDMLGELGYPAGQRTIVLNGAGARHALSAEDAERALGVGIDVTLPASPDVLDSVNRGEPLCVAKPNHPVSTALTHLTRGLLGHATTTERRPRRLGLPSRKRPA